MHIGQVLFVGDENIVYITKITDDMLLQQDVYNFGKLNVL
jgi:hypothetical protein